MLFRGDDETRVVHNADEKAAALAVGFRAKWLPCDGPSPEQAAAPVEKPAAVVDAAAATPAPVVPERKKPGRKPKPKE